MKIPFRRFALMLIFAVLVPLFPVLALTEGAFFGVWKVTCEGGPCRAFVSIRKGEETVVAWSLLRDPARNEVSSLIRVPVLVALPPGLRIYADDTTFFDVPFQVCDLEGCTAILVMDAAVQAAIAGKDKVR
ncbi:MAG: invasion associated locus B family protein, partial [Erythrobacter sp.]|nr:invasion associated locus B family protein [Erythrobacter sp.]